MNSDNKDRFVEVISAAYELHGKPAPSRSAFRLWWRALQQYPIDVVEAAVVKAVEGSKFLISPADVIGLLQTCDGRPDADEAWAIAKQAMDNRATVVWNDDIAEAYGIASEVYDEDKVGGRMAFRSAYERIVEHNRSQGIDVKWWATLGDPSTRQAALEQAEAKGLLSHNQVAKLLPTPKKAMAENVAALLEDQSIDTDDQQEETNKNKQHIAELRKILK